MLPARIAPSRPSALVRPSPDAVVSSPTPSTSTITSNSPSASTSTSSSYFVRFFGAGGSGTAVGGAGAGAGRGEAFARFRITRPFARPLRRNQARPGARLGWTPYEIEQSLVSMEIRADLSKNAGLSCARFSVLLFPHRDKERFVNHHRTGRHSIRRRAHARPRRARSRRGPRREAPMPRTRRRSVDASSRTQAARVKATASAKDAGARRREETELGAVRMATSCQILAPRRIDTSESPLYGCALRRRGAVHPEGAWEGSPPGGATVARNFGSPAPARYPLGAAPWSSRPKRRVRSTTAASS